MWHLLRPAARFRMAYGPYAITKAEAERAVLAAHGSIAGSACGDRLVTCVVRCVGLFGERDPHHITNMIVGARRGMLVQYRWR